MQPGLHPDWSHAHTLIKTSNKLNLDRIARAANLPKEMSVTKHLEAIFKEAFTAAKKTRGTIRLDLKLGMLEIEPGSI